MGDVKFVRMAGDETQPTRFAFVEFMEQDSVARALTFNGVMFGDRPLKYVLKFCFLLWIVIGKHFQQFNEKKSLF